MLMAGGVCITDFGEYASGDAINHVVTPSIFGGSSSDIFLSVTPSADGGAVAVGHSELSTFTTGDWAGVAGKGAIDATIVKYNASGSAVWKKNFGGSGTDQFLSVTTTSDGGAVAVGYSERTSFDTGDWSGIPTKGGTDAIIVKYNPSGNVVWKKNFGGDGPDVFYSVTQTSDGGAVAVGYSDIFSFDTGDWSGIPYKGDNDAIIVKYDSSGNVVWKKNFGGWGNDVFYSVTTSSDNGFLAVGSSNEDSFSGSFNPGDWSGVSPKGGMDAIIVKYDSSGNVVWKKNFGGAQTDLFKSVTPSADGGAVAVGSSNSGSFNTGDWSGVSPKGGMDAIIVKYNPSGELVWKKSFGGNFDDAFQSVTPSADGGAVAVGSSNSGSFNTGDWSGIPSKGDTDAIIVKYNPSGELVWKKSFGGNGRDEFHAVTALSNDDIVSAGRSYLTSFGTGDWIGFTGHGYDDAIVVKFSEPKITITSIPPAAVKVNGNFSYLVETDVPGCTITVTSAPGWLSANGNLVYGTPAAAGDYSVTITASKAGYVPSTQTFVISVANELVFLTDVSAGFIVSGGV